MSVKVKYTSKKLKGSRVKVFLDCKSQTANEQFQHWKLTHMGTLKTVVLTHDKVKDKDVVI